MTLCKLTNFNALNNFHLQLQLEIILGSTETGTGSPAG